MSFTSRLVARLAASLTVFGALALVPGARMSAQTPVQSGSVVPVTHAMWNQIDKVLVAKNGSVLFLDWASSALYQLSPGQTTFTTVASGSPLEASGTYWNSGMTLDAKDTLYITDRYGSAHFFRIPYNPKTGTWDFTTANVWGATIGNGTVSLNTYDVAFIDSSARDGSGQLVVSTELNGQIYTVPVDNQGNWGNVTVLVSGLKARATHIAADENGNVFFTEDEGTGPANRVTGVFLIPAGKNGIKGAGDGTAEAQCTRLDTGNTGQFSGISLDSADNIYLTSQSDGNGGAYNATLRLPNISGSAVGVTASSFDFSQATVLTPVQASAPMAVDPRGYFWIPTATNGWTPNGSLPYPGTLNVVLWQPGGANAGISPVGTTSTPTTVYFSFSQAETPGGLAIQQPGTGSDFVASQTNPLVDPTATPPQTPCAAGKLYVAFTSCPYFVALDPRSVGPVAAKLVMQDSTGATIPGSLTYLNGIGQGAAAALLVPTGQVTIGSGFSSPQQVTGDNSGNVYVADSGLGKVLEYPANSTTAAAGKSIGTGLTSPTGVSVDGAGDVYIGDAGKVYMIPFTNGALNAAAQTTLVSGLGTNLRLAAGLDGNVYVADPDNARVIELFNTPSNDAVNGYTVVGSGFTKPSAVAIDNNGNLYVGDGSTLSEINGIFGGSPAAITKNISGTITGIAVDPSGSINVAATGGITHIPNTGGALSVNGAVALDSGVITSPNGLGIDGFGNLFVSDLTGGTPKLQQITLGASVDFGQVSPFVPSNPVDVSVFDIGNAPLTFTAAPTFGGTDGADFSLTQATQNGCDVTGGTPVAPGAACILDPQVTASADGTRSGTMTVTTNAVNAPSITSSLTAVAVNNLERSAVTLTINPTTTSYPGSTTATVTVAPTVSTAVPTGQVILTLINQNAKLNQSTTLPAGTLANGSVTFNVKGVLGGTYTVKAVYHGDANFSGGLATQTLTVTQAAPTVMLTNPANIKAIQGTYYVPLGKSVNLTASVASPNGTPTGNITFTSNGKVADPSQDPVKLDASGQAVFATANLVAGTYSLKATYNGDQNFAAASSAVVNFVVLDQSVLLSADPASVTVKNGSAVTTTLTITSLVGYSATNASAGGVFLACDNTTVPKYSECTFDVQQVTVAAGGTSTTHMTLSTNLPVNTAVVRTNDRPLWFAGVLGLGLLGLGAGRRRRWHGLSLLGGLLLLVGMSAAVTGCTNSGYTHTPDSPHLVTPAGMYNVRVYATDPMTRRTVSLAYTLPVTVQ